MAINFLEGYQLPNIVELETNNTSAQGEREYSRRWETKPRTQDDINFETGIANSLKDNQNSESVSPHICIRKSTLLPFSKKYSHTREKLRELIKKKTQGNETNIYRLFKVFTRRVL